MMSVHDTRTRARRRFDGHKAGVDTDTQLITTVEVLPQRSGNLGALELVEESEANTGVPVQEAWATPIHGATRQDFADAGRDQAAPTGSAFPRMTLSSTWRRAVAPVRRDGSPTPSCRRGSGLMARDGFTTSGLPPTGPNV